MTKLRAMTLTAAALGLSACVPNPPPVVSSYNEASVDIQQSTLMAPANAQDPAVVAEANRICATAGRRAEYASTRFNNRDYYATHLFLCLAR